LRIKISNWLYIIQALTIILVLAIIFIPSSAIRIIIGLPFLLFFPGYTLISVLFPTSEKMDRIERFALSAGMSIAIVALIGFGLNYTSWGIRLEPILYSVSIFILIMSNIALIRHPYKSKLTQEFPIRLPGWQGSKFNKSLTLILVVAILGAFGVFGYTIVNPKIDEIFTELYILGLNGKAQDYPTEFIMQKGQIIGVSYGSQIYDNTTGLGEVTLGIVNHEQQKEIYSLRITIADEPATITLDGIQSDQIEPIQLQTGEKWEQKVGFAPQHIGDNQKVEFLLYKVDNSTVENSLHLWIDVKDIE
jgi:uncharacterized membrane protein